MIEEALVAELLADVSVSGLIGTRVYPLLIPQDAILPAIAYQTIGAPDDYRHDGASEYRDVRMQLTCQADNYAAAKGLARAVRNCLSGYVGTLGSLNPVRGIFLNNQIDGYGSVVAPPENTPVTVRLDFTIQAYTPGD